MGFKPNWPCRQPDGYVDPSETSANILSFRGPLCNDLTVGMACQPFPGMLPEASSGPQGHVSSLWGVWQACQTPPPMCRYRARVFLTMAGYP